MALIEFKNVNKYYGDYHALRDINLEIEKGQVVVLLGPSGSGKSTLIRTINALESIDNGTLIVNGHNVTEASAKDLVELRKEAGMVFQHFNLYPHKTVLENVTLAPIKVLGISKADAVMQNLAKGGMNMVVVTHEMGFARSVADRIIFMAEGQVLVDTTDVDGFFDNPTEPRAVQFLSKIIDHNSDNVQVDA